MEEALNKLRRLKFPRGKKEGTQNLERTIKDIEEKL